MGPVLLIRRLLAVLAALVTIAALSGASARAATPLSIKIVGNHFVNGAGQTVRLLGVNHPSFEYACVDGFGYDDGLMDDADAAAIASWGANAVRVPLNEDCWLGINGNPNNSEDPGETLTATGYQQAVENYVADLNAHGLYAILDLHWAAPGVTTPLEQQPMADMDHSPAFWSSVAKTFANNPAVVFDLYNEPFDPTQDNDADQNDAISWSCWMNGGCSTATYNEMDEPTPNKYTVAGMQTLLDAVRGAGAEQPVMVGGLSFADDLSQWTAPSDPDHQVAASMHAYAQEPPCSNNQPQANGLDSCFDHVAAIAQNVPVVIGEFGQNATAPLCDSPGDQSYDSNLMNWADQNGVSYTAWGWVVETQGELNSDGCSAYELISDPSGTPFAPNGTIVHSHLLALAGGSGSGTGPGTGPGQGPGQGSGPGKTKRIKPPAVGALIAVLGRHHILRLTVSSNQRCHGTASIASARKVGAGKHRRRISFGKAHFSLIAHHRTQLSITLSHRARRFLAAHPNATLRVSLTLVNAGGRTSHTHRALSLQRHS